jgi:hypothetical protein
LNELDSEKIAKAGDTMTGVLKIADGTQALPGLAFGSDPDTGIFYSGSNSFSFSNGNALTMQVTGTNILPLVDISATTTRSFLLKEGLGTTPTAGAPAFSFNGDPDTGMYSPAVNELGFSTAGTARMRLDSSGNVGIGTPTPSARLSVTDNDAAVAVKVTNTTSTAIRYPAMQVFNYQGTGSGVGGYPTVQLYNYRDNAGGAAAAAQAGDVLGSIIFGGGTGTGQGVSWNEAIKVKAAENYTPGAYGSDMYLQTTPIGSNTAVARVTISSAGNVLIGTGSARATLDVSGAIVSKAATSNGAPGPAAVVDFGTGNLQYTNSDCGAYKLYNLKDGGSYSFAVKGTVASTCVFTGYSDSGTTLITVHYPPDHDATISGKHTMYTFLVMGGDVYISWVPGL